MRPNMKDVAALANVSVATVSHVINNTRFVSPETRQKVLDSIKQLEFYPDPVARILKTGKKNLIGFIVPDIANEFFATIIEEVEAVLGKHNYKLIVVNTKETKEREIENLQILSSGIVDGLIIASTLESFDPIKKVVPENFPMIFIDRTLPDCNCDTIIISNYDSMFCGVERLILKGHTKIGYITGLFHLSTTKERFKAYKDALEKHNILVEDKYIKYGGSVSNSSIKQAEELINEGCTALVVSNNVMASEVLYFLYSRNIKVGEEISLLGYNDSSHPSYMMNKIDYIAQPVVSLGRKAGEQILERIKNPQGTVTNNVLHSSLYPFEQSII